MLTLVSTFFSIGTFTNVHGISPISTVSISPVNLCCSSVNHPFYPGFAFTVNVTLSLITGQSMNGFDVIINYTRPYSSSDPGVLRAGRIDTTGNVFADSQNAKILLECIDNIQIVGNGCGNQVIGQLRIQMAILGTPITGPVSGNLFTVTFSVTGYGESQFIIDKADLLNPHSDPQNPDVPNPVFIPVLKYSGVFGNYGVVAFFNYWPVDTSVTPSLLPNQDIVFDASPSFVPTNSSLSIRSHAWNFGDGTFSGNVTSLTHHFVLPGNYTVTLNVVNSRGDPGNATRRVNVSRALGTLQLTVADERGTVQRSNVYVKIYNSSISPAPFAKRYVDGAGNILFNGLAPSNTYYLSFSGTNVENSSRTETVKPGWTTLDTVYLKLKTPSTDYGPLIYIGTILGGLGIVTAAIIYKKRSSTNSLRNNSKKSLKKKRTLS